MDQRFSNLYGEFVQGSIDRRSFLQRLSVLGAATAAVSVLPSAANAIMVLEADPRIKVETVAIPGGPANFSGYLATPTWVNHRAPAKMPAVIVVGEATSMNANIKDVVRRYATEGFVALGVDFLSPLGGTPVDPQQAQAMTIKLRPADVVASAKAASRYLKSRSDVSKVGIVGFSWGGGVVNDVLVEQDPSIDAAVYYYGRNPDLSKVGNIRAPIMAHYAALDNALLQQIPAYQEALTKAGKDHVIYIYPATNHGFNNDTSPARWEAVASRLAWERSVDFFRQHLAG